MDHLRSETDKAAHTARILVFQLDRRIDAVPLLALHQRDFVFIVGQGTGSFADLREKPGAQPPATNLGRHGKLMHDRVLNDELPYALLALFVAVSAWMRPLLSDWR